MAVTNTTETVQALLEKLDLQRQAYLETNDQLQALLIQILLQTQSSPILYQQPAITYADIRRIEPANAKSKTATSIKSRRRGSSTVYDASASKKGSLYTAEGDSSDSDEGDFFAQNPLPAESYTEDQLREHLKEHKWHPHARLMLGDLIRNDLLLSSKQLFEAISKLDHSDVDHTQLDCFEVDSDGSPLQNSKIRDVEHSPFAAWEALSATNVDKSRRQAVGRIIILREPSPMLFGAAHLTMNKHFDMDSLYRKLIDDESTSEAYIRGYLSDDPRRASSIAFVFKYHTIVGKGRPIQPWQNHDDNLNFSREDHIPISTCSSVVALSLSGNPIQTLKRNSRKKKSVIGHVYDPFAPWRVLLIQCFPDWRSSMDTYETSHHYVNGPDAFLTTLLGEYRDATTRFRELNRRIVKLVTPPRSTIFDRGLRDQLLFENDE